MAVKCKWVFRTKIDMNGVIVYYKTMLVAKRCSQVEGVHFSETFALVAKLYTIIVIFVLGDI